MNRPTLGFQAAGGSRYRLGTERGSGASTNSDAAWLDSTGLEKSGKGAARASFIAARLAPKRLLNSNLSNE